MFRVTSIRNGFAGGGFDGAAEPAEADGDGGGRARRRSDSRHLAELFLGFTSTQKAGLGPPGSRTSRRSATSTSARQYFAQGTHMHLSHLFEDLERWYLNFDHRERVDTTFRPGLDVPVDTLTVPQGPDDVQTPAR